jgi:S-adenosylmethionine/arginine decarboxylase-like enzyme
LNGENKMHNKPYGYELIIDLHDCNPEKFNRKDIDSFLDTLCRFINMEKEDLHFWDYEGEEEEYKQAPDHLKGTSAVQFIKTSTIVVHTLDILKKAFINIFSCKEFSAVKTTEFTRQYFEGNVINWNFIERA